MECEAWVVAPRGFSFHHSDIPSFRSDVRAAPPRRPRYRQRPPDVARPVGGAAHGWDAGAGDDSGLRDRPDEIVGDRRVEQRVHGLSATTGHRGGMVHPAAWLAATTLVG